MDILTWSPFTLQTIKFWSGRPKGHFHLHALGDLAELAVLPRVRGETLLGALLEELGHLLAVELGLRELLLLGALLLDFLLLRFLVALPIFPLLLALADLT